MSALGVEQRPTADEPWVTVDLTVNGEPVTRTTSARLLLSDFLRHELGLTGTHVGCEHGVCGGCTVMIDGSSARSCLLLRGPGDGAEIRTIECLSPDDGGAELRAAGVPGLPRAAVRLTARRAMIMNIPRSSSTRGAPTSPTRASARRCRGNLCRCTGYQNIVAAVRRAAELPASAD